MIARRRGDFRLHTRWRPASSPTTDLGPSVELATDAPPTPKRQRLRLAAAVVVTVLGIAVVTALTVRLDGRAPAAPRLPATPRQWVNAWAAAAVVDPERVCQELYAPALAAIYKPATGRTCLAYFANTNSTSFRIRRVLVDGNAAAVEARQTGQRPHWGYFTMLLSHVAGGWQAIDLVPGAPIR